MFDHAVVGVRDEDAPARDAIALGAELAGPRGRLTLLRVDVVRFEPAEGALSVRDAEKRDRALERLRALARACRSRPRSRGRRPGRSAAD